MRGIFLHEQQTSELGVESCALLFCFFGCTQSHVAKLSNIFAAETAACAVVCRQQSAVGSNIVGVCFYRRKELHPAIDARCWIGQSLRNAIKFPGPVAKDCGKKSIDVLPVGVVVAIDLNVDVGSRGQFVHQGTLSSQ